MIWGDAEAIALFSIGGGFCTNRGGETIRNATSAQAKQGQVPLIRGQKSREARVGRGLEGIGARFWRSSVKSRKVT